MFSRTRDLPSKCSFSTDPTRFKKCWTKCIELLAIVLKEPTYILFMWYFESIVSVTPYMNVALRLRVTEYILMNTKSVKILQDQLWKLTGREITR